MEENREISYFSDASHNYLVLECPAELKDNYQYKMLAANQISGLLQCSGRTIDSREYLYYDITSRQSLADLYDGRPVRGKELLMILEDLLRVQNTLTEYLLDTAHLIPDPSFVYMDFREQECCFVYYPGSVQDSSWEKLFTFLADRVEGRDKKAAALIYKLCMLAEKPGFRLQDQMLEELSVEPASQKTTRGAVSNGSFQPTADSNLFAEDHGSGRGEYTANNVRIKDHLETYSRPDAVYRSAPVSIGEPFFNMDHDVLQENMPEKAGYKEGSSEGRKHRASIAVYAAAGVMIVSGLVLLLINRFMVLAEREMILTFALGGFLIAAGAVAAVLNLIRRRKHKRTEPVKSGHNAAYQKPELWEQESWQSGIPYADFPENAEFHTFHTFPERRSGMEYSAASRMPGPESFGETCLLAPDSGQTAGLYGTGSCRGEQISLTEMPCVIGKMREYVDQVLDDSSVSRMHARFALDRDGHMTIRDLNSTNGTWLNGERLGPNESRSLQRGDHVRLGRMEFVYR